MQRVLEFPEGVALEIEAYHDVLEPIRKGNAGRYCCEECTHQQATSCATGSAASSIGTMPCELGRVLRPFCVLYRVADKFPEGEGEFDAQTGDVEAND
jgi:hypothetical protein